VKCMWEIPVHIGWIYWGNRGNWTDLNTGKKYVSARKIADRSQGRLRRVSATTGSGPSMAAASNREGDYLACYDRNN